MRSLLLAWFASQNRSLFAARCLVEVVIEMYRDGVTVDDVAVRRSGRWPLAGGLGGSRLVDPAWVLASVIDNASLNVHMIGQLDHLAC